jgi:hypothetical protein
MYNTELLLRLRKYSVYRITEPFEVIMASDEDVRHATLL